MLGICKLFWGCKLANSSIHPAYMKMDYHLKDEDQIDDTQPQTQSQAGPGNFNDVLSQPIENVWGRLCRHPNSMTKLSSLDLCGDTFAAGRDATNNLTLTSGELHENVLLRISKVHFVIRKDLEDKTGPVYIEDKSRNGTFVNNVRINKKVILLDNDTIALAHTNNKIFKYKGLGSNEAYGLPDNICKQYHVSKELGRGACGTVRLVYDRLSCKPFAMKHIQMHQLSTPNAATTPRIMNEVQIMKDLQHPCIIKMHNIIKNTDALFIFLEVMNGGDLLRRIKSKEKLSEQLSKLYFLQMVCAVKYLHDHNITHRDLKPDNILLESTDDETVICISDFGLSKLVHNESVMRTLCGTPLYVAPEVLITEGRGSYDRKVDIWSLGVVLYTCLSGTMPFSDGYGSPACEQIKQGKFEFRSSAWNSVTNKAKSFIKRMLTVNPEHRPSIDEVLQDRWLDDAEVITKAERLMKMKITITSRQENEENFLPPATKRRRIDRKY